MSTYTNPRDLSRDTGYALPTIYGWIAREELPVVRPRGKGRGRAVLIDVAVAGRLIAAKQAASA